MWVAALSLCAIAIPSIRPSVIGLRVDQSKTVEVWIMQMQLSSHDSLIPLVLIG